MKSTMKLCLAMISCISATGYCAEKPLNADKIIRKAQATGKPIPAATVNQIMEQQKAILKKQELDFAKTVIGSYIDAGKPVPTKTISIADTETAALARQHNQKFQLHNEQQPK